MSRLTKSDAAQLIMQQIPQNLKHTLFENKCTIPLPMYDAEGMFKSYIQPRNGFSKFSTGGELSSRSTKIESVSLHNQNQESDKKTFKDFEHLQMINHISLKDPVLESFLEKAKEME